MYVIGCSKIIAATARLFSFALIACPPKYLSRAPQVTADGFDAGSFCEGKEQFRSAIVPECNFKGGGA
ncbi:hypothetical protein NYR54_05460 [Chelativorans sp. SCAU2101]|uniref:Lipoprotein n=1 Tax=Chelativorans petroleitrophicus TaxID=2975484 RepID=A0A9X2X740_9HYPH|nr:hypothetical protein [Chelativorans petroleitrophicus]MCT8989739.1 hypothetical protein [Chelativorans petroleitrophicus]